MRSICRALLLFLLAPGIAQAQATNDLRIIVGGFQLTSNGAEKAVGVSRVIDLGWVPVGKPVASVFSMFGCGYFAATVPPETFEKNADAGWRIELTPTKVAVDHAVTFRIRWTRALDTGKGFTPIGEDLELTLKPGESRPLDSVAVPATAKTTNGEPCTVKSGSLRLSVEFDAFDRRLFGADVWLVERLASGKEESQLQSVRAIPHQKVPFYFDSISDGTTRYDLFGSLVAELKDGGILIEIEAVRARPDSGQDGYQSARWFRATVRAKPGETVEVALTPRNKEEELANRVFSLRIRAKQIR